ncbi:MAG: ABC transporter permease [Deltaproteobacteria bacterium]|nr:ABC transporter permease [Deltaproteobacteria bacterium]
MDAASGAEPTAAPAWHQETLTQRVSGFFLRDRRAMVGMILLVVMLFAAFVGPRLVPYEPDQPNVRNRFAAPSWSHWMGTDRSGRDLLSRVLAGASISFRVAIGAALLALLIGAPLGAVTSYIGGLVDDVTQRCMDAIIAFPARLLAIVLVVLMGPSVVSLWFAIAFSSIPRYARIIRGSVLDQKEREYVEAAHAIGEGRLAILFLYILPNVLPPLAVQVTLDFASAVSVEASLSFLGLGLVPPTISWGGLLNDAQQWLEEAPWLAIFPGAALALTVLSFVLIGDAIRDHLDPRTRRRGGMR